MSDVISFMIESGRSLLNSMSTLLTTLSLPLSSIVPVSLASFLESLIPGATDFLSLTLFDCFFGAGITLLIGFAIVKWVIS